MSFPGLVIPAGWRSALVSLFLVCSALCQPSLKEWRSFKPGGAALDIAFSKDGVWLAVGCFPRGVAFWRFRSNERRIVSTEHSEAVSQVIFPNSLTFAYSFDGKTLMRWRMDSDRDTVVTEWDHEVKNLTEKQSSVIALAPDDRSMVWGTSEGAIRILDINEQKFTAPSK